VTVSDIQDRSGGRGRLEVLGNRARGRRTHSIDLNGPSCAGASSPAKVLLHDRPCADRPQGPQLFRTRAAASLMAALRDPRWSPPWTPWTILCRLTGTTGFFQRVIACT
jgi:hypothetical protein